MSSTVPATLPSPFAPTNLINISLLHGSLTDHSCLAELDGEKAPRRARDPLCKSGLEYKDKYKEIKEDEDEDNMEEEEEDKKEAKSPHHLSPG
ncbi:UNVERIFIED_CONTAM: hypothetical protein K2H54_036869 [Gekko kuhli]